MAYFTLIAECPFCEEDIDIRFDAYDLLDLNDCIEQEEVRCSCGCKFLFIADIEITVSDRIANIDTSNCYDNNERPYISEDIRQLAIPFT
jgi:hypothetical protein